MSNVFLIRSQQALARAIEYDERKKPKQAIREYGNACELALRAIKAEPDGQTRAVIISRLRGWLERAEQLKAQQIASSLPDIPSPEKRDEIAAREGGDPLADVKGMDHVKQALAEAIILPSSQPQVFVGERKPWKGILLYGPPGTGKTFIASRVAKETGCTFFSVSSSDIVGKYLGESEKAVRELFDSARKSVSSDPNKRAVIFIDEVDSIGQARGRAQEKESDVRVLTELLRQMDGVGTDNSRVVVIGATNLPQHLDPALRRRFERRLLVPLPGLEARAQILAKHLGPPGKEHSLSSYQVIQLARHLKGSSGADLASFGNEVLLRPVRKCLNATHFTRTFTGRLVPCPSSFRSGTAMRMLDANFDAQALEVPLASPEDADYVLANFRMSTSPSDFAALEAFDEEFGEKSSKGEADANERVDARELAATIDREWAAINTSQSAMSLADGLKTTMANLFSTVASSVSSRFGRSLVAS